MSVALIDDVVFAPATTMSDPGMTLSKDHLACHNLSTRRAPSGFSVPSYASCRPIHPSRVCYLQNNKLQKCRCDFVCLSFTSSRCLNFVTARGVHTTLNTGTPHIQRPSRAGFLQAFASHGQSLVPIMAMMSNTLINLCVYVRMKGVPHPKK